MKSLDEEDKNVDTSSLLDHTSQYHYTKLKSIMGKLEDYNVVIGGLIGSAFVDRRTGRDD